MKIIATIETDFPEKFGIPRQSGIVNELRGKIIFEPEYRSVDAVKGLDGYEYIWLLWQFDDTDRDNYKATVKPPRLGGNKRVGVFATRSPFRPNNIGLSSVKLQKIEYTDKGPVLFVSGADLKNNTKIYDIKPYLPYTDAHPDAKFGFASEVMGKKLKVIADDDMLSVFSEDNKKAVVEILAQDPRPSYQNDPDRKYGVSYAGYDIHFTIKDDILNVFEIVKL